MDDSRRVILSKANACKTVTWGNKNGFSQMYHIDSQEEDKLQNAVNANVWYCWILLPFLQKFSHKKGELHPFSRAKLKCHDRKASWDLKEMLESHIAPWAHRVRVRARTAHSTLAIFSNTLFFFDEIFRNKSSFIPRSKNLVGGRKMQEKLSTELRQ